MARRSRGEENGNDDGNGSNSDINGHINGKHTKTQSRRGADLEIDAEVTAGEEPPTTDTFEVEEDPSLRLERHKKCGCHSLETCLTAFLLYIFNLTAFFVCGVIVAGQIVAWEQFDVDSPELVVLGITVLGLAVVSLIGLRGTCKKEQHRLRMCVAKSCSC